MENEIYKYLIYSSSEMTTSEDESDFLDIGTCCFCGFECNPSSQSCGSCARGISGVAIGLPVPIRLKKFLFNHPTCDGCDTENPIALNTLTEYKGSSFFYCQNCLDKKEDKNMCEKCHENIIGFKCEINDNFIYVCYNCKCDNKCC